jgi:hypothetical protein
VDQAALNRVLTQPNLLRVARSLRKLLPEKFSQFRTKKSRSWNAAATAKLDMFPTNN